MGHRICDETKELMQEGWVMADAIYLKYQKDVDGYLMEWAKDDGLKWEDIKELRNHYFDYGMYYWTTWYDDDYDY